eukprot:CAMPEP_0181202996 /NCGR_PEP_ID=MMETSP1096-20121128/19147_1 /TAXON_ID=156174 ORGANISM="Chrysochromulina ericina, Strain CCMP281" /NCGR_SAMPLE_ID=MMETSP1096 /ASSEMBLY_ACC=CAM_ASM_000453 /LENGTH=74 /DNA_ID=CAMNT_0023293561 /DNA_START=698 /DNA_END=918 /DNA_ORIENTATION=+
MEERWVWAPTPEARAQAEAFPGAPGQRRAVLQEVVHSKRLPHHQVPRAAALRAAAQRVACEVAHQHSWKALRHP